MSNLVNASLEGLASPVSNYWFLLLQFMELPQSISYALSYFIQRYLSVVLICTSLCDLKTLKENFGKLKCETGTRLLSVPLAVFLLCPFKVSLCGTLLRLEPSLESNQISEIISPSDLSRSFPACKEERAGISILTKGLMPASYCAVLRMTLLF